MYTVSPPYITADNNGGASATHHSGSGGVGYTSLNEGGDGGEGSQLEGSVDDIPGKGPGGVPEKYFTVSVLQDNFIRVAGATWHGAGAILWLETS